MEWIKVGGIFGIVLMVLFIPLILTTLFFPPGFVAETPFLQFLRDKFALTLLPFLGISLIFIYSGFIKVSSYTRSKYLRFSSIWMFIFAIIFFLLGLWAFVFIIQDPQSIYGGESSPLVGIGYLLFFNFLFLLFGQTLFLNGLRINKSIRFARMAGILGLILIGIIILIGLGKYLYLTSSGNSLSDNAVAIIFAINLIFLLVLYLFETIVLFNASKEFEKN